MSQPLRRLAAPAIAVLDDAIDTDVIFPARFLLRMEKEGLGECLFADLMNPGGDGVPFALELPDGRAPQILLAGAQFGCGSSREHAVWSLVDFGIRVVIAPSFGEIFANNAARNGLAAIALAPDIVTMLAAAAQSGDLVVDMLAKSITAPGGVLVPFDIGLGDQQALINGWNEIDMIEAAHKDDIGQFEADYQQRRPWLFTGTRAAKTPEPEMP